MEQNTACKEKDTKTAKILILTGFIGCIAFLLPPGIMILLNPNPFDLSAAAGVGLLFLILACRCSLLVVPYVILIPSVAGMVMLEKRGSGIYIAMACISIACCIAAIIYAFLIWPGFIRYLGLIKGIYG